MAAATARCSLTRSFQALEGGETAVCVCMCICMHVCVHMCVHACVHPAEGEEGERLLADLTETLRL